LSGGTVDATDFFKKLEWKGEVERDLKILILGPDKLPFE